MKFNIFNRCKLGMGVAAAALSLSLTSCSDFFSPETDDHIAHTQHISQNTEMYTGFIGIITKMQAIGDKEILLTDTRAEMLEPTTNASTDLINVYDYADNLKDNSYATPAPYYEVIIACNDYLAKIKEYRKQPQADDEVCQNLISSTIRIKAWTYKTIGEIYGEAAWCDDPVGSVNEYLAKARANVLPMKDIVDKCLNLLDNGFDGVPSDRTVDWIAWLDPSNVTNIAKSDFRKWNYLIPPYEAIYSELCLWKGAYLDNANGVGSEAARTYYEKAADLLFTALNTAANNKGYSYSKTQKYWFPNNGTNGKYSVYFRDKDPAPVENVCCLLYDYSQGQTNGLIKHFNTDVTDGYLLKPSEIGMEHFTNPEYNPGGSESDTRYKTVVGKTGSKRYIAKFRLDGGSAAARPNPWEQDCYIYIYRAMQYHLMLSEALNQLNRFRALNAVLNTGTKGDVQTEIVAGSNPEEWKGFNRNWTQDTEWGTISNSDLGVRGCFTGLTARPIQEQKTVEAKRANDIQLLKECELELSCEGKTYPWMNRVAVRYNDASIVADEVCPKYEASGKAATVRAKIMNGGNWVKYPL